MKKILALGVLISFYALTQLNFTSIGSTGKNNCDSLKIAAKKCSRLVTEHMDKLKHIEAAYKKSSLDYNVNMTAQNSAFVENYLVVARESESVVSTTETASARGPANSCQADGGQSLKNCMDEAKKIYQALVPN
ncbi:MAG: hypothetical protein K0R29_934 [Pseudobdellovibrio sp.]|jgi:hypothetical protein|nr:hypothetical protein [Pseudobdellovibrio sp.]